MLKVYFKPNCATCQTAMQLMKANTEEKIETVEYLVETPSEAELKEILQMLGMKAEDLVRKKEHLYKEQYEGKDLTDEAWIKVMHDNPILIERPIVVKDGKAILGRPIEKILDIL